MLNKGRFTSDWRVELLLTRARSGTIGHVSPALDRENQSEPTDAQSRLRLAPVGALRGNAVRCPMVS